MSDNDENDENVTNNNEKKMSDAEKDETIKKVFEKTKDELIILLNELKNSVELETTINQSEKNSRYELINALVKKVECLDMSCEGTRDLCQFIQQPDDTIIQIMYDKRTHGALGIELN